MQKNKKTPIQNPARYLRWSELRFRSTPRVDLPLIWSLEEKFVGVFFIFVI